MDLCYCSETKLQQNTNSNKTINMELLSSSDPRPIGKWRYGIFW